ncbi:DUF6525 family protein [Algicella marina]|uniref:Uncharacterized protein n=1 Tax=Algicella marina TaxID=2683284 RepID=A0A6P1T2W3_9RHOB|nr:DUF6525 family protein [Algicella marina]QHQ35806.1 hypothetical protein GO499_11795 [Algicella marina]
MARKNNLGATGLRTRRRGKDPMREFDALPTPLRHWLAQASLPWSPASCRRIWLRARDRGEPIDVVLARLQMAERQSLARRAQPGTSAIRNGDEATASEIR